VAAPIHVVPHTHWDREWYLTFESFRAQLCTLAQTVLDACEQNHDYTFMFDGQVAPVDDYLEIRPDQEERLRGLVARGALGVGPWYTLSDQFLVSGETTLRNLERGLARARGLGAAMEIAYCPDQFGQMAQLPQLLRSVGIHRVVAMRGVPRSVERQRFRWIGLDGTEVDTLNLVTGYYLLETAADAERLAAWRARMERENPGEPLLLLCGRDHETSTGLPGHLRAAGGRFSSLTAFWEGLPAPDGSLPRVEGELRSPGRESLTTNVVSNRVDIRLATARAERELERYAEPLAAFACARYPQERLDRAWLHLIHNAAHDSICATSIDEVTDEVMVRARQARDLARGVTAEALAALGGRLAVPGLYVWNPSPFARTEHCAARRDDQVLRARDVPPLGWARVEDAAVANPVPRLELPRMRLLDQADHGDTYNEDCDDACEDVTAVVERAVEWRPGDGFTRLRLRWDNHWRDHRVRLLVTLPEPAADCVADTAFGAVRRPAVPPVLWGRDRFSGYPAARFVVAGGLAVLVDRVTEFELLPETGELALTLLRATGALSRAHLRSRPYPAGPEVPTERTQLLGEVAWELGLLPWPHRDRLPWEEWERFALPMPVLVAPGGGDLPERGTAYPDLPAGNLSAVLPEAVRVFDPGPPWRIATHPMRPSMPAAR
jgi:alpha-mannosidase